MQGQKQEFTRKQRKLFSRDKSGLTRNPNRLKSKESDDKYILDQNSPKPRHLILGLRDQLTNLRQEVAKLSRRDNNKGEPDRQVRLEYQGYSPRQKKITNSRFLEQSRTQHQNRSNRSSRNKSREEVTILKTEERQASVDRNLLASQLKDLHNKNKQLQIENSQLRLSITQISEQLRRDYQNKIKHLQRQREENYSYRQIESDRTVIIQKQNQEQQEIIQQLRQNINQISLFNAELKKQVQQLRHQMDKITRMEQQMLKKDRMIEKLMQQMAQSHKQTDKLRQELLRAETIEKQLASREKKEYQNNQQLKKIIKSCQEEKERLMTDALQIKSKCFSLQQENSNMKKKIEKMQRISISRTSEQSKLKIQELQEVIAMQEKSIDNYESDLNYLESQLTKVSHLKPFLEQLTIINDELNEECVRLRLQHLNHKYRRP